MIFLSRPRLPVSLEIYAGVAGKFEYSAFNDMTLIIITININQLESFKNLM